jgi:hypothetical protein
MVFAHPEHDQFRHQPANAGKVVFLKGDVAMSNDRQLQSEFDIRTDVASRNRLRKENGLPPVDVQHELERIHQVQRDRAFEQSMQSPLRYRVEQRLLQRVRRRRDDPGWRPTGVLSGGGWAFHSMLVKQMGRLNKRLARS